MTWEDVKCWAIKYLTNAIAQFLEKHPGYSEGISLTLEIHYLGDQIMASATIGFHPKEKHRDLRPIYLVYTGSGQVVAEALYKLNEGIISIENDLEEEVRS